MDSTKFKVTIPTFINAHIFWIVAVKDILLRSAMSRFLKSYAVKRIKEEDIVLDQMVAINVENIWTRALVKEVVAPYEDNDRKCLCWLPDYGAVKMVKYVFELPLDMQKCPHLAKQASLHNVINVSTELTLGSQGFELQTKKTYDDIPGVTKAALACLEEAKEIIFTVAEEDSKSLYGDITCINEDGEESLTEHLINKKLLAIDELMFEDIAKIRNKFLQKYFDHSPNWKRPLHLPEKKNLSRVVFNTEKKMSMEYFERAFLNNNC